MEREPSIPTQPQPEASALRAMSQDLTVRCSLFKIPPVESFFQDDSQKAQTSSTPIQMSAEPEPETRGQVMPNFGQLTQTLILRHELEAPKDPINRALFLFKSEMNK